jgi:hypothetical protein
MTFDKKQELASADLKAIDKKYADLLGHKMELNWLVEEMTIYFAYGTLQQMDSEKLHNTSSMIIKPQ